MTANEIANIILGSLAERQFPIYMSKYDGGGMAEADVFGITRGGYMYEYEIKCSRSDFYADFKNKRHKHWLLESGRGSGLYEVYKRGKKTGIFEKRVGLPNRFYFACEPHLLMPSDIPPYAGLVYIVGEELTEIKAAPLIHREKATIHIYTRVATILSERMMWGMSYVMFKHKERKLGFELAVKGGNQ